MSTRKAPPAPINPSTADKGKSRAAPPSRNPSYAGRKPQDNNDEDDDAPPTSTLRARNVTGASILDFPPSPGTPRSAGGQSNVSGGGGRGTPAAWRLPGVKGTMGGLASPARGTASPTAWSPAKWAAEKHGENLAPQRPPVTFRTDPTLKSCLDTLPLDSKDEIKRLFGVA